MGNKHLKELTIGNYYCYLCIRHRRKVDMEQEILVLLSYSNVTHVEEPYG